MITLIQHIILCIGIFTLSVSAFADESHFDKGVAAHDEENFALAIAEFEAAISEAPKDIAAHYNLGLSAMGDKNYGKAIWAFEKVLKFSPKDGEAKGKIERCYAELYPDKEYSPVLSRLESGLYSVSSTAWSMLAIVFSLLFAISIVVFKRKDGISIKRLTLITSFFSIIGLIVCTIIAYQSRAYQLESNYGVIVEKSVPTFVDTDKTAKTDLTAGMRLEILSYETNGFSKVRNQQGSEYLIKSEDIELL